MEHHYRLFFDSLNLQINLKRILAKMAAEKAITIHQVKMVRQMATQIKTEQVVMETAMVVAMVMVMAQELVPEKALVLVVKLALI